VNFEVLIRLRPPHFFGGQNDVADIIKSENTKQDLITERKVNI
jgi:hypothetical protein